MKRDFVELHRSGTFLLVNVHDAGSAILAANAGAEALGTTSSGLAYCLGRRDAVGAITRDEAVRNAAEICSAVDIPVSIDAENGWGHTPEEVSTTISALADVGAAGASIEDWSGDPAIGFYDRPQALERIQAAVDTAAALNQPFVVNARAEAFLHQHPEPLNEAIARLQSFRDVGAHCVYAPGPSDLDTLSTIVQETGIAVNALIGVGSQLTMADAAGIGIRRVSVGGSLYRAAMTRFANLVSQLVHTGSFKVDEPLLSSDEIENLFP